MVDFSKGIILMDIYYTPRELEVLATLIKYNGNKLKTANELVIALTTLKTHMNNISAKIGANSTAEMLLKAIKSQIVSGPLEEVEEVVNKVLLFSRNKINDDTPGEYFFMHRGQESLGKIVKEKIKTIREKALV